MPALKQDALTPQQRDDIKELVLGSEGGREIAMGRFGLRRDQIDEALESMGVKIPWQWDYEDDAPTPKPPKAVLVCALCGHELDEDE